MAVGLVVSVWNERRAALVIVKPETVIAWDRRDVQPALLRDVRVETDQSNIAKLLAGTGPPRLIPRATRV